ncbi:hypothetical protein GCM10010430_41420 [Kitasatospora cystarginea]|uniref:Uncharacterized protein n=1 Tax=Kitasatospora cystarginea TaxID=58350 RepID=A0ABP5R744_9ACTN
MSTSQLPPEGASAPAPAGDAWLHPVVAAHLRPGETLLAAAPGYLDGLLPALPREYLPNLDREAGGLERAFGFLVWLWPPTWFQAAAEWVENRVYPAIRRKFHGGAWSGGWESTAGRLLVSCYLSGDRPPAGLSTRIALAVTSHRLLLLTCTRVHDEPYDAQVIAELPHGTYRRRGEPHPARQRCRLDLEFGDGSWLAFELSRPELVPQLADVLS